MTIMVYLYSNFVIKKERSDSLSFKEQNSMRYLGYLINLDKVLKEGVPAFFSKSKRTVSVFVIIAPICCIRSKPFL